MVVRDRMLQAMSNVTLAVHLLNETYSHESFWKPYIGNARSTTSRLADCH